MGNTVPGAPEGSLKSFMSNFSLLDFDRESPWTVRGAPSSPMYDELLNLDCQQSYLYDYAGYRSTRYTI